MGEKFLASGVVDHIYSTGWPDWIFEQALAIHDHLYTVHNNGRSGLAAKVVFDDDFGRMIFETWSRLHDKGIYIFGGPEYAPNTAFNFGQIAMLPPLVVLLALRKSFVQGIAMQTAK